MSLFNPYVLLGIVLSILSAFGGGYYKGGHDETVRQQLEIVYTDMKAIVELPESMNHFMRLGGTVE